MPEHPVDARAATARSPAARAAAGRLAIAMRVGAHPEGAAGRVVGGDEQQPAVGAAARRTPGARRPSRRDPVRLASAGSRSGPPASIRRPSRLYGRRGPARPRPSSGMAVEHSSRPGDDGPGDVGELEDAPQVPAGQQAVAQRAAEGVAGAETVDDLDRVRAAPRPARRGRREHALGALLDDGQLDARGPAARRRRAAGRSRRPRPRTPPGCRPRR